MEFLLAMGNRVIAVVISWNLRDDVLNCIESLISQKAIGKIVLVDNASSDGTVQAVRTRFPAVDVIENKRNIGFAAAANAGIRRAMELGAEFTLLVNSDVIAPPGSAERLINAAVEENAAAVGAKLFRKDDPSRLDAAYGVINWRNFISRLEGSGEPDGPQYSMRRKVDYPHGAFLLLRNSALEKVGLFDESYFAYHEEMELCERFRRAGYPVIFEPVAVYHAVGKSIQAAGAELAQGYLLARNSVRFVRKYGTTLQKFKFWIFVAAAIFIKYPFAVWHGTSTERIAAIHGWWDGLLNKPFDNKLRAKYHLDTQG
jgi:GT2 family glycosyltransferase